MSLGPDIKREDGLKHVSPLLDKIGGIYSCFEVAGSIRRGKKIIHDVDIVIVGNSSQLGFNGYNKVNRMYNNVSVNLLFTSSESFGAALLYYTGSMWFNIICRSKAKANGLLLNEYGLFDRKTGKFIAGAREEDILSELNLLKYIDPLKRDL